jgi:hypothetical protein
VIVARTGLILLGFFAAPLLAQERAPALSSARVASQIAVGTLATPVAFIAGGLAAETPARTRAYGSPPRPSRPPSGATDGIPPPSPDRR